MCLDKQIDFVILCIYNWLWAIGGKGGLGKEMKEVVKEKPSEEKKLFQVVTL